MSPQARRILVPVFVIGVALGIVAITFFGSPSPSSSSPPSSGPSTSAPASSPSETGASETDVSDAASADAAASATEDPTGSDAPADAGANDDVAADGDAEPTDAPAAATGDAIPAERLETLRARAAPAADPGTAPPPASLGSLDPAVAVMQVEFSLAGAGIERIAFSDIWETAEARHQAERHRAALAAGRPGPGMPDESLRYVLHEARELVNARIPDGLVIPDLAASRLLVDGRSINLFAYNRRTDENGTEMLERIWAETAPGRFETEIVDDAGTVLLRVIRTYALGADYDVEMRQTVENRSPYELEIQLDQWGPGDLRVDRARYIDRRRYRFGWTRGDSGFVSTDDDLLVERQSIITRANKGRSAVLWPTEETEARDLRLSWFGPTNRYFGFAVHPPVTEDGTLASIGIADRVSRITFEVGVDGEDPEGKDRLVFTFLEGRPLDLAPDTAAELGLGVFAGPLDREILGEAPYSALAMEGLILYQMSSFCAICTFQWLAHLLLGFLTILHDYVVFDWGLAIIGLVIVVRTLLHPITKKSQIGMMRFGRVMQKIKPEIEKLQKKYPDDPKRMQQEQLRLMQEYGVNPAQMLGCLPMFLQMPIWVALYAMLYFAFDLRQQPAFFGIFQSITGGAWPFLGDLSSGDHFFYEFETPRSLFIMNVTGINLLPLLMAGLFWVQQKYMAPPTTATMTPEQEMQTKIMRFMMIVMMPLFLYSAPSGLTLYILTSSTIGILESRYIRSHVDKMDIEKKPDRQGGMSPLLAAATKGGKPKDAQARAYQAALERAEEKRRAKKQGSPKAFKKRK